MFVVKNLKKRQKIKNTVTQTQGKTELSIGIWNDKEAVSTTLESVCLSGGKQKCVLLRPLVAETAKAINKAK